MSPVEFKKTSIAAALAQPKPDAQQPVNGEHSDEKTPNVWAGKRLVALVAAVAVVSLLAGVAIMQFIVSPAEMAARTEPPEAGPVTALVEERTIENTIIARGEVTYADSVDVEVDTSTVEGRPIVTGQVPQVGDLLNAGSVALEVVGRPVIVLNGALPAYRSLSIGMSGPDVMQLKNALDAMGYWAGDLSSDVYEWDTATAVGSLYENTGYLPATGGEAAEETLRSAYANVRSAEIAVTRANTAYNQAASQEGVTDLSVESIEIEEAQGALSDAYAQLESAQQGVLPTLPSSEVLFLTALPRRVDDVFVKRGDSLSGNAMVVSGAELTIEGSVSKQDADLLRDGMVATYTTSGGEEKEATITKISAPTSSGNSGGDDRGNEGGAAEAASSDRFTVQLDPGELSKEEIGELRGTNVRLLFPIASTEGEVLAVPLAALSAGADGGNRVELLVAEPNDPFKTETIQVTPGLAAGGFVEITSEDARIASGAKVVVGR